MSDADTGDGSRFFFFSGNVSRAFSFAWIRFVSFVVLSDQLKMFQP